jgi:hypothetical protein
MFYLRRFSGLAADAWVVSLLMIVVCGVLPVAIRSDRLAADAGDDVDMRRSVEALGASRGERTGDTDCTRLRPLLRAPVLPVRGVLTIGSSSSSCIGATGDGRERERGDATGVVGADVDINAVNALDVTTLLGDAYCNIEGCDGSIRGVRGLGADMGGGVAVITGEVDTARACTCTSAAARDPTMIPPLALL